jgi:hypothetical protein
MRLYEFLAGAASRPYRDLVQHHIRHQSKAQLLAASVAEVDLLPHELKPLAERFIDLLNERILRDRVFWQTVLCTGRRRCDSLLRERTFWDLVARTGGPKNHVGCRTGTCFRYVPDCDSNVRLQRCGPESS